MAADRAQLGEGVTAVETPVAARPGLGLARARRGERRAWGPVGGGDGGANVGRGTNGGAYGQRGGGYALEGAEKAVQPPYGEQSGSFVVVETATGSVASWVGVRRHNPEQPGHRDDPERPGEGELELSSVLHPR